MIFRHIHATTTNPPTYARLFAIIAISFLMANYFPYLGSNTFDIFDFFSFNAVNVGLLFAIISGFLMMITLSRKQSLMSYISIELNKIRRIYHLANNLAVSEPALKNWFKEVDSHIHGYFNFFKTNDFRVYEQGNDLFRHITYTIYQLPQRSEKYNPELYTALLQTTSEATEAREQIRSQKDGSIGFFQWASMIVVTMSFALIIASATPPTTMARILGGIVIFNLLLMLQLLYEYDRINARKGKAIAKVYLENEALMHRDLAEQLSFQKATARKRTRA